MTRWAYTCAPEVCSCWFPKSHCSTRTLRYLANPYLADPDPHDRGRSNQNTARTNAAEANAPCWKRGF